MLPHHQDFWWHFFPKKELTQVYLSAALRSFAISLLSLFVPLYLYVELDYTLAQTIYFYIFYAIVLAATSPLAAKFSSRFGIKHSVMISVPFYLLFILLLYLLPIVKIPLMLISSLAGFSIAFYWMGMHLVFHHVSDQQHRGEEVGIRMSVSIIAAMFGPLIGGILIKFFGFPVVFAAASFALFLSAIVLFMSAENHVYYRFSFRSILNGDHWKNSLFFISRGTRVAAGGVVWPLFIFFILNDYLSLGLVGSVLSGISAVLVLIVGKYSDRINKRKIIGWAVGFESLSWFFRALVRTTAHVFGATIFGALTVGFLESPLGALEYDKVRKDPANYFVSREIFVSFGRILLLMVVLMTNSLSGGLIFHGFANLAALLF